jgi:hypothetical protein
MEDNSMQLGLSLALIRETIYIFFNLFLLIMGEYYNAVYIKVDEHIIRMGGLHVVCGNRFPY